MHIIYKNEASYCVTQFLTELAPSAELFGSKLSEGCCVVSNHFSISSPTVVSKHHWPQYQPLDDLSPDFIVALFKWHGSVSYGGPPLSQPPHFIPGNPYARLSEVAQSYLTATPRTAARQAPRSIGFSRQAYWSGLPCPSPTYSITSQTIPRTSLL